MTERMLDLLRTVAWHANITGPVMEIGSFIEAQQEHLDLRQAFARGVKYVGIDVLDGPGVDVRANLLDLPKMEELIDEHAPKIILCLYVLEHVWDMRQAAATLGSLWRRNPESWLWVATHQNQPFHGTIQYGDWWRVTVPGFRRLMEESGVPDARIFVHDNNSNPEDILAVRQPLSTPWPSSIDNSKLVSGWMECLT